MSSKEITRDQATALVTSIVPAKLFLERLRARMHAKDFPGDDPLLRLACEADDAVQALWGKLLKMTLEAHWLPSSKD